MALNQANEEAHKWRLTQRSSCGESDQWSEDHVHLGLKKTSPREGKLRHIRCFDEIMFCKD